MSKRKVDLEGAIRFVETHAPEFRTIVEQFGTIVEQWDEPDLWVQEESREGEMLFMDGALIVKGNIDVMGVVGTSAEALLIVIGDVRCGYAVFEGRSGITGHLTASEWVFDAGLSINGDISAPFVSGVEFHRQDAVDAGLSEEDIDELCESARCIE